MFSCTACLRRAISLFDRTDLITASVAYSARPNPHFEPHRLRQHRNAFLRSHSTVQSIRLGHHRREIRQSIQDPKLKPNQRSNRVVDTKVNRRNKAAISKNAGHLDVVDGTTRTELARQKSAEFQVQFLNDPLRLASAVLNKLRDSNLDEALELVRASERVGEGKILDNVVSWNHCIDWTINHGEVHQALKIFNEMKKRGHRPDAHTYTILLKGFGRHPKKPQAVANAIKIYDSISAPNSTVKPNSIHTNAVIHVCARAGDMDSLWAVAGRFPETGPAAADKWTYTTIINAIRDDARKRAVELAARYGEGADTQKIFEEAIADGRRLWTDITKKWRKADLLIDEALTCAMGRLLMTSSKRTDLDDVYSLVQQTMNIPRASPNYVPQEGGEFQQLEEPKDLVGSVRSQDENLQPGKAEPSKQVMTSHSFFDRPNTSTVPVQVRFPNFAPPSNNTLSMLIETSTLLKQPHMGRYYWEYLTSSPGNIQTSPDPQNIMAFLRLLRISRSSKAALELLSREWPKDVADILYKPGSFIIAMSTCVRDKNNPNVFETATKMLELMEQKFQARSLDAEEERYGISKAGQTLGRDPRVLAMYLNLAIALTKGVNPSLRLKKLENGDLDFERDPKVNYTIRALDRISPSSVNLLKLIKLKLDNLEDEDVHRAKITKHRMGKFVDVSRVADDMEDILTLVSAMISAYDKIVAVSEKLEDFGLGPLDSKYVTECRLQSRKLTAYRAKLEPALTRRDGSAPRKELWEGYSAMKVESQSESNNNRGKDEDEDEDEEDINLSAGSEKTPERARFRKEVRYQQKQQEWSQDSRGMSRRQKHEVESLRHEERVRRQFPPSMLKPRLGERTRAAI